MQHLNTQVVNEYDNDEEVDEAIEAIETNEAIVNESTTAETTNEDEPSEKECKNCHEVKAINEFGTSGGKSRAICKKCVNSKHKEWRDKKAAAAKKANEEKPDIELAEDIAESNVNDESLVETLTAE